MDWSILLIILLIIIFICYNQSLNISHRYQTRTIDASPDRSSGGFIKPEHRLLYILNHFSSGDKIELHGNTTHEILTKDVVDDQTKSFVINNLKQIITNINSISSTNYYIKTIENLYIQTDRRNNKRYIVDFFIYDIKHYYTIRILIDFVIVDSVLYVNIINILSGSNVNIINKYDYKFNSKGILLDIDMFTNNIEHLLNTHYKQYYNIVGVNSDTDLEYSRTNLSNVLTLQSLNNIRFPSNLSSDTLNNLHMKDLDSYLEIYSPQNIDKLKSPQFCEKYLTEWDNMGIPLQKPIQKSCILHNTSTVSEYNEPWFGPSSIFNRVSNDQYQWLKNPANGNIMKSSSSA